MICNKFFIFLARFFFWQLKCEVIIHYFIDLLKKNWKFNVFTYKNKHTYLQWKSCPYMM